MNAFDTFRYCKALGVTLQLDANEATEDSKPTLMARPASKIDNALAALLRQHKAAIVEALQTGSDLPLIPDDERLWISARQAARNEVFRQIAQLKRDRETLQTRTLAETQENRDASTIDHSRPHKTIYQPCLTIADASKQPTDTGSRK